jgi:CubicO group peptidase (beta-lactamase class C family)
MYDSFVYTPADSVNALFSFNYDNSLWRNDFLEMTYGDKNIYASARDMLKWDQALYTDQLISQALLDSAFTPSILTGKNLIPAIHNYGLGFRLKITSAGKKVIYHFGRWHGFNAAFSRLPDEEITIIILGNKFTRSIYTAASSLYEIFGNYNPGKNKVEDPDNELVSWQKELPASKHSYTSAPARANSEK